VSPGPAIDIHTHVVPRDFPPYLGRHDAARWPSMERVDACRCRMMLAGKPFRTLDSACWTAARRLADMDGMAVRRQALSPMPELLSYWLPLDDALALGGFVNDTIAGMVDAAPDRFVGLGTVPLQAPERAAEELRVLMRRPGFRGVEIGTHAAGRPLGDPVFDPFFAAAEETGAAVFVHPLHPIGGERLVGPPALGAVIGYPCELAFAIASLITGGTLDRFPRLRLAFSHGGGAFALVLPRLRHVLATMPALGALAREPVDAYAGRLFYDTLVYDRRTLRFLLDSFGERQLMIGTDYPFEIYERDPVARLAALDLPEATLASLHAGAAMRFLGL